ncbi:MAG: serine hydrolase [Clostridia bacterium]
MVETFHQIERRIISENDLITLCENDKIPSCGALSYMHNGLKVTIANLCNLMIILSDNTISELFNV